MHHTPSLIATIVAGIGLAFILGTLANRLRISPLVGYLLAGVAVGPYTPVLRPIRFWRRSSPRSASFC